MFRPALAACACAALATTAVIASAGADPVPAPSVLVVDSMHDEVRSGMVDNAPRGKESAGDMFTVAGPLRDPAGAKVGAAQAEFVQVSAKRVQGSATFTLGTGSIVILGRLSGAGDDTLAVVGGTGAYAGAGGSVHMVESADRTTFTFQLDA